MTALLLTLTLFQQHITTSAYGVEVPTVFTVQTAGSTIHKVRNLNGREVPVETVQERLISDLPGVRIIERTIRRYDPNGQPGPVEKQHIETRTAPAATQVLTTIWRGDVNGNLQMSERRHAVTRRLDKENANTTLIVERSGHSGRLEIWERSESSRKSVSPGRIVERETIARRDLNGRWTDVAESTTEQTRSDDGVQEIRTESETSAAGGMRVIRRTVSRTAPPRPDGKSVTESDIFEPSLAGRATAADSPLHLTRQHIVERTQTGSGVTESVSVRFTDASSPGRLSSPRKVEEIVCEGECQPAMMN